MAETSPPAVVLFIYNRPAVTQAVFDTIRRARPERLLVFADGPRDDSPGDRDRTEAARAATDEVDWPCDVSRDYLATNVGIKTRVESGLTRVFEESETAIILEDDCLPHPSFFPFCASLLARYRDDPRVMTVCGSRLMPVATTADGPSYVFSSYPFPWGWATWRRAWQRYDGRMTAWPQLRDRSWLQTRLGDPYAVSYWTYVFDTNWRAAERGDWDTAWVFASLLNGDLSIIPAVNLITNIGFDRDATHTRDPRSTFAALPRSSIAFPLRHPEQVSSSAHQDRLTESVAFSGNLQRLLGSLRQRVRSVAAERP